MNEPVRRQSIPRSVVREQRRDVVELLHQARLDELRVAAIGHVTKRALLETGAINRIRQAADRVCPEADELTAMIAAAAAVKMTEIITDMGRGW